jgi:hypothetical protein
MDLLSYFDLNRRSKESSDKLLRKLKAPVLPDDHKKSLSPHGITDIAMSREGTRMTAPAETPALVSLDAKQQIIMYAGILVGVLFSNSINVYTKSGVLGFNMSIIQFIFSMIIAIMIVPSVYSKLSVQSDSPFLVQFGFFVMNGITWQVVMGAVGQAASV